MRRFTAAVVLAVAATLTALVAAAPATGTVADGGTTPLINCCQPH